MAIENAKYLNTRIILKNDTLSNWEGSSLILQPGEVAFAKIESSDKYAAPTYLMKVGDGVNTFSDLKWVAANAADVYSWAKSKEIKTAGAGNAVTGVSIVSNDDGTTSVVLNKEVTFATAEDLDTFINTTLPATLDEYITESELTEILKGLEESISDNTDAIAAIEADYLKAADKEALQAEIDADVKALADGAVKTNADAIAAIEADYLKAADKEALQAEIDADVKVEKERAEAAESGLNTRLTKVETFFEGAAEDSEGLNDALDTLVEIQNYINEDGEAAAKMVDDIAANAQAIESLKTTEVKTNADEIAAIKADYLKADAIDALEEEVAKKANDADLAAIAKTGSTDDLVQGGLVLVFDCGTSEE